MLVQVQASICPYRVLGVPAAATEEQIKAAYRRKALELHPDVCKKPQGPLMFTECQLAYQTLMDPEQKAKCDARLAHKGSDVLSYLNSKAAVRHGYKRTPSAKLDSEVRATMMGLLMQAKYFAKKLEHDVLSEPKAEPVELFEPVEPWMYHAMAAGHAKAGRR